jgi:hypothetical protein
MQSQDVRRSGAVQAGGTPFLRVRGGGVGELLPAGRPRREIGRVRLLLDAVSA